MRISPRFRIAGVEVCRSGPYVGTLSSVATNGWVRLAELVTNQRANLGYSIAQLAAVSGLSTSTVDSLEHARKTSYDPATLAALERALRWKPGSVERALKGLEPQAQTDPDRRVAEAFARSSEDAGDPRHRRGPRRQLSRHA